MFGVCKRIDKNLKKMNYNDYTMVKLSVFLFTLFLVTVSEELRVLVLSVNWYAYLGAAIILSIPVAIKILKK